MGFLSNMFNLKTKYVDDPDDPADMAPKEGMKTFYLDPDSAKTVGKNAKAPVQDSSSEDKVKDTAISVVAPVIESEAKVDEQVTSEPETTSSEARESTSQSSPTDDSMDMFRNMARKMKRR